MGFRPEPTTYKLKFEGTDLDGLEVTVGSLTVGQFTEMLKLAESGAEDVARSNEEMLSLFERALVSWNLEDQEGQPVPVTAEGIASQETRLVTRVIAAWQVALTQVPPPLPGESSSGGTSPEASLDLASASQSPPS